VHFVSAVLIAQDAAVVGGHLLLRVLFGMCCCISPEKFEAMCAFDK
jgi:hypothetical protein